jgi:hypothetical protein
MLLSPHQDLQVPRTTRLRSYARGSTATAGKASWGNRPRESEQYRLLVSRAGTQRLCDSRLDLDGDVHRSTEKQHELFDQQKIGGEEEEQWIRDDRIKARERVRKVLVESRVSWGKCALGICSSGDGCFEVSLAY